MFSKIRIFRRMHLGFSETSSSVFTSPPWQLSKAKLLNTACLRTAWSIPVPLTGLVGRLAVCILIYKFAYTKLAYSTVQQYSTVQYRRGKREEGEEPVSKHQIRPGDGRWTGRRGVGRLNPRRENKIQGKNGDGEGRKLKKSQGETSWKILARKRRRRGRAERRRLQQSKRRNSTCARTGDRSCHAQRSDDGGGWDTRSWTGAGCFECVRSTGVRHHRFAGNPSKRTVSLQPGWLLGVLQR